jgi:hypothetical protein
MNISATETTSPDIIYPIEDIIPAFRASHIGRLLGDITILAAAPVLDEGGHTRRLGILTLDEDLDIELRVLPQGFTKQEILELRDRLQDLDEGTDVTIAGTSHTVALFSSCLIVEDHEVYDLLLTFQIDPFA